MRVPAALLLALALPLPALAQGAPVPSPEELARQIEAQRQQIEALAAAVEKAQGASSGNGVKLGGYGELHYNNLKDDSTGAEKREMDFHRFVLFIGYDFTDSIRFVSELELEHALAGEGKPGEVELEQAYVEFDLPLQAKARAGLFLVPVGILNETHEPTTFYGVERNPVESNIIPTTWWEGGGALVGQIGNSGFSYDLAAHSGLKVNPANFLIRGGRQKVANATAEDLAYTVRLRYSGTGLRFAATAQYQEDLAQDFTQDQARALLTEAHAVVEHGPFAVRALYAEWDVEGAAADALGRDEQKGWYSEAAYRVVPAFGFFSRYSVWDNGGIAADTETRQVNSGFNFWPHPSVVLKLDVQTQSGHKNDGSVADDDGFNLGVGYRF